MRRRFPVVLVVFLALLACGPPAGPATPPPAAIDTLAPAYPVSTVYPAPPMGPSGPAATSTPLFRPTATPTLLPTRTPTPFPTHTATPAPPPWTPAVDDPYGPGQAVAMLTIEVNGEWQPYYLTPAGNVKPVFPPIPGLTCNSFAVRPEAVRFLCWSELDRGMAALDPSSGQVITATPGEGYYLDLGLASPDGRWLAYLEGKPLGGEVLLAGSGNHWRLRAWEAETGRVYDLAEASGTSAPLPIFWSRATGKVYWTTGIPRSEACCYGLWGALPTGEEQEELPDGAAFGRQLSPDGRQVAFPRFNPELGETFMERIWAGGSRNEVALLDLVGHTVRLLWQADPGCQVGLYGWLPDGEIALTQVCPVEEQYQGDIFTIDQEGVKVASLWSGRTTDWSGGLLLYLPAAGSKVLARESRGGESTWWLLDWRSGEKQVLPDGGRIYWSWCGQDRLAYSAEGPLVRSRLDLLDVVTGQSTLLWEGPGVEFHDVLFCR